MVRAALAACWALVTVAGPWLCCCHGPTRLAALLTGAAPVAEGRCPGCGAAQGDEPGDPVPSGEPHAPGCPCRDGGATPVYLSAGGTDQVRPLSRGHESGPSVDLVGHLSTAATRPAETIVPDSGSAALAFRSPRDMLRALHVLRC